MDEVMTKFYGFGFFLVIDGCFVVDGVYARLRLCDYFFDPLIVSL